MFNAAPKESNTISQHTFIKRSLCYQALLVFFCQWFLMNFVFAAASVQQNDPVHIPPALVPWQAWVQHDTAFRQCPLIAGETGEGPESFLCAWPGKLQINADVKGMSFSQGWQVHERSWIPLPGNAEYWPQRVKVNGEVMPVMDHDGPAILLSTGRYQIDGNISWQTRPQVLTVPEIVGMVDLQVDGRSVIPMQRQGDELTLGRSLSTAVKEADNVETRIYRKLSDGLPAFLTTQVVLHISGKAREIVLGPILPEGFTAVSLDSSWRARHEGNFLYVQVQPGDAILQLVARSDQPLTNAGPTFVEPSSVSVKDTLDTASADDSRPFWVEEEVWSYESAPDLRVTAITGGINPLVQKKYPQKNISPAFSVDPKQSGVPPQWHQLPAFVMNPGSALIIEERSRGIAADESNRLKLSRTLWLDFDGNGFFARDTINGTLNHGWRLDMAPPFALERANDVTPGLMQTNRVSESALLVTHGASSGWSGIEWRNTMVALNTGARVASGLKGFSSTLPVNGWQQSFDTVATQLRLPYGYLLLAAPGADHAYGSWIEAWNVLDVFFAAFISLLAWRFLGVTGGVVTALYLVLGMHEANAPMWTLACVLLLSLLVRALPKGKLARFCKWLQTAACVVFLFALMSFMPTQLRYALYPQLENSRLETFSLPSMFILGASPRHSSSEYVADEAFLPREQERHREPMAMSPRQDTLAPAPASIRDEIAVDVPEVAAGKVMDAQPIPKKSSNFSSNQLTQSGQQKNLNRYSQSTVVQTGGGEPRWSHGHRYQLEWSGPVLVSQEVVLLISPPWLTRTLRVILCLLLGVLAWRIFRAFCPSSPTDVTPVANGKAPKPLAQAKVVDASSAKMTTTLTLLPLAILFCVLSFFSGTASAQANGSGAFPPEVMLQELQRRLNKPPACVPNCADLALAQVSAEKNTIRVGLEVHAAGQIAFPLPQAEANLTLKRIEVNGRGGAASTDVPILRHQGQDWIAIERGVHQVSLDYVLSVPGDIEADVSASMNFPLPPRRVIFSGKDWGTEGIDEERLINETLRFTRIVRAGSNQTEGVETAAQQLQQFPPFVRVVREFTLDLDWSIDTQVLRIAPERGGFTLPIPLVSGEHVLTPGFRVQSGEALVSLGSEERQTGWYSRLDKTQTLKLTAPALTGRAEVWRIRASAFWRIDWQGVPVNLPRGSVGDDQVFEFYPLPGETLILTLTQPEAIKGESRAIDQASLRTEVGLRATRYLMRFQLRASQGGEHVIELPKFDATTGAIEVLNVQRDNQTLNLRPQDGKLTLPVSPGIQTFSIEMRRSAEIGSWLSNPEFNLGLGSANIDLELVLPAQRWLLVALGPQVGPAILYWGELVVAIAIAFLLGRSRMTRLRIHHWLLLALGFSTFSWMALAVVVFWLIAIDWREKNDFAGYGAKRFDLMQIGLVLLTLIALGCLISVIPGSLMGSPDMHVVGQGSYSGTLHWFADHSDGSFPQILAFTVPIWIYRALMLVWSLWLAVAIIRWLRQAFFAWTAKGYWRKFFNRSGTE